MKKILIVLVVLITVSLSFVLKININQYDFSMSGESGDYSSTLKSNFYEVSYYLFGNKYSFDLGKAKFRVQFIGSSNELEKISLVEVEFDFNPYFSGTHTSNGEIEGES